MNKKDLVKDFIDYMLIKTKKMFKWDNLPNTIPSDILEEYLQTQGKIIFYKYENNFFCLPFNYTNKPNVYNIPSNILINNVALNLNRTEKITLYGECENGFIIKNDSKEKSLLPIFNKYGELLTECDLTIKNISQLERMKMFLVANDDKTKNESKKFLDDICNGKLSSIAGNPIFESIKMFTSGNYGNSITQFIELIQYLKASCLNEIGLNSNYNMKRERINTSEIELNNFGLLPLCENMLEERQKAIEQINRKFNLNITVDFGSIWKIEKETLLENKTEQKEEIEQKDEIEQKEEQEVKK